MKELNKYVSAEIEVIVFNRVDVITSSGDGENWDNGANDKFGEW